MDSSSECAAECLNELAPKCGGAGKMYHDSLMRIMGFKLMRRQHHVFHLP